jgi:tetraacyldisaccharide 4'-kinase
MSPFFKIVLWPLALIYRIIIAFWDIYWRIAARVKLPCRVISVGNITAGGTGKTPIVIMLSKMGAESGRKVAVVAKGYKRKSSGLIEVNDNSSWQDVGDEPLEVYRLTDDVRVYVDNSKTKAARRACADGAEVIIVDDGFQHRKLQRDLDIVCLDWAAPFGPGGMLPIGLLREPARNLKRADLVIFTSYDPLLESNADPKYDGKKFYAISLIKSFLNIKTRDHVSPEFMSQNRAFAFCGLAAPEKFIDSLRNAGIDVAGQVCFTDHHDYGQKDIDNLVSMAGKLKADYLITTFKDAVKIEYFDFGDFDVYSAMLEISITDRNGDDQKENFRKLLSL